MSRLTAFGNWIAAQSSRRFDGPETEVPRHAALVAVRFHWVVFAVCLFELVYRPDYGTVKYAVYALVLLLLVSLNAYNHYQLRSHGPAHRQWLMTLLIADIVLLSVAVAVSDGFSHYFLHLLYYPVLAGFAVLFTSIRLNMAVVTLVSLVYLAMSLTVGEGIDLQSREEKALLARIGVMYAVVLMVNLANRFERMRWMESMDREREIQRERLDLSRTIHDTVAQTAYMVGLGVDRARKLADDEPSHKELVSVLDGTAELTRSVIWELRRPLDAGQVYEGASLGGMIEHHAATFTTVTSVPASVVVRGAEPPLSREMQGRLFAIAHNALSNAFRHARAERIDLELAFERDSIRLSVSDNGVGLPGDYASVGSGFGNMQADANAIGGVLQVGEDRRRSGTIVTCTVRL